MKKKYAIITALALSISTSIIYADVEIYQKNNNKYTSIEEIADKLDMKLTAIENKIILQKYNKSIVIDTNETFAKIGEKYVAIDTEVINGYVVPKDTDIIIEKNKTYIPLAFVENNKIIDELPQNEEKTEIQNNNSEEDDDRYTPPTSSTRPPTGGNRPSTGGGSNDSNNSNDSNDGEDNNSGENEENQGNGSEENEENQGNGSEENEENPGEGSNDNNQNSGNNNSDNIEPDEQE
ncbi:stalk domain-containing protein [Romboutsia sp.]|uniref:stalk domain-containing protein n=1 Tax=Romboutsia sp. TaxID=1965302 RepID=UPI003F2AEFAD